MPTNDRYSPDVLAALVKGLDKLGPESTALLYAAKPAIRNAIKRGVTSAAIRQEINRSAGIMLSAEQLARLLERLDDDDEVTKQGALSQALAARPSRSPPGSGPPCPRHHSPNESLGQ